MSSGEVPFEVVPAVTASDPITVSDPNFGSKLEVGMSHEDGRVSGICFEEFMRSPNVACRKVTACLAASVPLGSSREVPASGSG